MSVSRRSFLGSVAATSACSLVLPALLRTGTARAATTFDFYIAPNGSNSNSGTLSSPWALSALQTKSQIAGKRVGLLDGKYVVSDTTGLSANNNDPLVNLKFGGSSAAPTVIEAVNHQQAIITTNNNGSYPAGTFPLFAITADYVTLRGLHINNLAFYAIMVRGSHTLIEDCEIDDIVFARCSTDIQDNCGGIGTGSDGTDLIIRNCEIHDIYQQGTSTGPNNSCIGPMYNHSNVVVEYSTLYNSGAGISPKRNMGGLIVRNNFIYAMQHYAIRSMTDGDSKYSTARNQIYNNIFNKVPCLSGANDPEAGMNPINTDFYNNTVVFSDMSGSTAGLIHYNGPGNTAGIATSNKYYNNIFYLPSSVSAPNSGLMFWFTAPNNRAVDRLSVCNWNCWNDVNKFKLIDSVSTFLTRSLWQLSTGFDVNSVITDPLFSSAAGTTPEAFKLQAGSPCLKAGRTGGTGGGSAVDIGAWGGATQIGAGTTSPKPNSPQLNVA